MNQTNKNKAVTIISQLNPDVNRRLEAAVLEIFSESDFHKASIRAIAKKAGISFSTIYKHFDSKEKLLFAYIDIWLNELTDRIVDHLHGMEDLKEKLRKVLWLQLDYYERQPWLGKILFMTLPMKTWITDESFQQRVMINLYRDVLKNGQTDGILDPELAISEMIDLMNGLIQRSFFMWVYRGQKGDLTDKAGVIFTMVWRAISKPEVVPYGF